jgi:hypothetical protein
MRSAWFLAKILDLPGFATVAARACAILLLISAAPALADDSVFTVTGVAVDETAASATAAREVALARGQGLAWQRLLDRLVPTRAQPLVPEMNAARLAELVRGFEVADEKTSNVRYLAVLRVEFAADAVRRLLRESAVPFAETPSKPVVVLPVLRRAGVLLLWDAVNGWFTAWRGLPPSDGLVPMVVPEGALADVAVIGPEQALAGEEARIAAIARRYGAADALVAYGAITPKAGGAELQVTTTRVSAGGPGRTIVQVFDAADGESETAFLVRAAAAVRRQAEETWKRDNILRFDERRTLVATAPLADLGGWVALRKRVDEVAFVERSELLSLSRRQATLRLSYLGDEEQLTLALAQHDLALTRGATSWELRMNTAGSAPKGEDPSQ